MSSFLVRALLVQAGPERVRIILGPHCLDFRMADILEAKELPAPEGLTPGSAILADVTIRAGASLVGLASSQAYLDLLWKPSLPFSFVTRPADVVADNSAMVAAEAAFMRQRGLAEEPA